MYLLEFHDKHLCILKYEKLDFLNLCEQVLEAGSLQDKNKSHFLDEQDWFAQHAVATLRRVLGLGLLFHQPWKLGRRALFGRYILTHYMGLLQVSQGPATHSSPQSAWMSWPNFTRPAWKSEALLSWKLHPRKGSMTSGGNSQRWDLLPGPHLTSFFWVPMEVFHWTCSGPFPGECKSYRVVPQPGLF